jgi:hypothetical protein
MAAPFRITRKTVRPVAREPGADVKDYLERLVKLIPAEVISLYLVGKGIIESERYPLLGWTLFCLVAVVLVRLYGTADPTENKPPQLPAVLIACISYLVWVYSMGDVFVTFGMHFSKIGSLLVLGWTFVVPYVYQGDPET